MPIDHAAALAAPPTTVELRWSERDVLLYHLGIGAGTPPTAPAELRWTYERELRVLPSFATVAGAGFRAFDGLFGPGLTGFDWPDVLHGGQRLTVHRPLPAAGRARARNRVVAVHDKGHAAVVVIESAAQDEAGPLWTSHAEVFVRGAGGFGGERGPSGGLEDPTRPPDLELLCPTRPDQALLYRLSGDRNPLHVDPEFAAGAGFERPILHGLCSYGIALKAAVDHVLDGDPSPVRGFRVRFAGVCYPGETLRVRLWRWGEEELRLTATVVDRDDAPVLSGGRVALG